MKFFWVFWVLGKAFSYFYMYRKSWSGIPKISRAIEFLSSKHLTITWKTQKSRILLYNFPIPGWNDLTNYPQSSNYWEIHQKRNHKKEVKYLLFHPIYNRLANPTKNETWKTQSGNGFYEILNRSNDLGDCKIDSEDRLKSASKQEISHFQGYLKILSYWLLYLWSQKKT